MNQLFSQAGLRVLESLSFTRTLYAFDYDGTLSKIVAQPEDAVLPARSAEWLKQLSEYAPVAVISGRSIADLKRRVNAPYLVGNHGLEGSGSAQGALKGAANISEQYRLAGEQAAFGVGVEIEDKQYSLALHYRRARNKKTAKAQIVQWASALRPEPRMVLGKSVVNVIPPGAPHKGMALESLMVRVGAKNAFYIGDDDTDEDVFALPNPRILSVRVGVKRNSRAKFYIQRQSEMNRLLKMMVGFYQRGPE